MTTNLSHKAVENNKANAVTLTVESTVIAVLRLPTIAPCSHSTAKIFTPRRNASDLHERTP